MKLKQTHDRPSNNEGERRCSLESRRGKSSRFVFESEQIDRNHCGWIIASSVDEEEEERRASPRRWGLDLPSSCTWKRDTHIHASCSSDHSLVMLRECVEDQENTVPCLDVVRGETGMNLIDELRPFRREIILDHRSSGSDQLTSAKTRSMSDSGAVRVRTDLSGSFDRMMASISTFRRYSLSTSAMTNSFGLESPPGFVTVAFTALAKLRIWESPVTAGSL